MTAQRHAAPAQLFSILRVFAWCVFRMTLFHLGFKFLGDHMENFKKINIDFKLFLEFQGGSMDPSWPPLPAAMTRTAVIKTKLTQYNIWINFIHLINPFQNVTYLNIKRFRLIHCWHITIVFINLSLLFRCYDGNNANYKRHDVRLPMAAAEIYKLIFVRAIKLTRMLEIKLFNSFALSRFYVLNFIVLFFFWIFMFAI